MSGARDETCIKREFGLSHSDIHRILPRCAPQAERVGAVSYEIRHAGGGGLRIDVSAEKIRRLGALKIPYVEITFRFIGWSAAQRAEFFEKFERAFQKGGG